MSELVGTKQQAAHKKEPQQSVDMNTIFGVVKSGLENQRYQCFVHFVRIEIENMTTTTTTHHLFIYKEL